MKNHQSFQQITIESTQVTLTIQLTVFFWNPENIANAKVF